MLWAWLWNLWMLTPHYYVESCQDLISFLSTSIRSYRILVYPDYGKDPSDYSNDQNITFASQHNFRHLAQSFSQSDAVFTIIQWFKIGIQLKSKQCWQLHTTRLIKNFVYKPNKSRNLTIYLSFWNRCFILEFSNGNSQQSDRSISSMASVAVPNKGVWVHLYSGYGLASKGRGQPLRPWTTTDGIVPYLVSKRAPSASEICDESSSPRTEAWGIHEIFCPTSPEA